MLNKSQIFILLHHISLAIGLAMYGFQWQWAIVVFLFSMFWAWIVGNNINHYYFAHATYKDSLKSYFYTFLCLTSGLGSPLSFSASHRQHHKYTDTEKDPHSPHHIGWKRVYFLDWAPQNISRRIIRDFVKSKFQIWVHKHWYQLHIGIVILIALIDLRLLFFGLSPGVLYSFHSGSLTNTLSHIGGEHRNVWYLRPFIWWGWAHGDHHSGKFDRYKSSRVYSDNY